MYTLERLEAALLARWGREEMTVYADYLQSIGDPRGEVIAIDLVNLDTVKESAWRARRQTVLAAWLGEDLATKLGGQIFQGFVQEASTDDALLASAAGEFVRAARFTSDERGVYERFAARPRRWVGHMSISGTYTRPLLDDALVAQLVAATPRLDQLVLRGRQIARRFVHPAVRLVRVEGRAVGTVGWGGGEIAVPDATFAIERVRDTTNDARLYLGDGPEVSYLVDEPALQKHVTHLRFSGDRALLDRALGSLPRVAVVETSKFDLASEVIAKRFRHVAIERITY